MRKKKIVFIAAALLIPLAGCSLFSGLKKDKRRQLDDTITNVLTVDESVWFIGDENPTTGFAWHGESSDDTVLEIVSNKYFDVKRSNNDGGVWGKREIEFKAKAPGMALVTVIFKRADDEVHQTIEYMIMVKGANGETGNYGISDDTLGVGKTAWITLRENPTTGYVWHCEIADETVAEIISNEYKSDLAPINWTGVGGTRKFEIKALAPGETVITMTEKRGDDVSDIREYRIVVIKQ